jgi:DNA-binding LytR/AlgR family response regulator
LVYHEREEKPLRILGSILQHSNYLPALHFVRCHRCFIINVHKVYKFLPYKNLLIMKNNGNVPVSLSKRKNIDALFN